MTPNERALKNHDELFPGHVSTLAVTDPELIDIFDNFAFDEVLRHGDLNARTRLLLPDINDIRRKEIHAMQKVVLNNGVEMPILGFGVFQVRVPQKVF